MGYVIVAIVCLCIGFVAGFLVYRKNSKRFKETEAKLRGKLAEKGITVDF